ncbi:MAG TPA: solute carrier family 23 protein, partial [Thermomicrobiales bacterium]|nr:solute carrier family 23 protein [Thermomicrobiales bacterium]
AISLIAPVAIILVAENTGHIKAVSAMTGRNLMPFLGRGFIGDGVATTIAGLGGGTGVTTYAENIGVMAVTRVFSTAIFVIAAGTAIVLGFIPKFGALIGSIPAGVLGGVSTVLFGLITITGVRIWVENQVDFSKATNLFIAGVTVIIGAADYTLNIGDFALGGIGLGTFGAIILYQVFRYAGLENVDLIPATDEVAGPPRSARPRNPNGGGRGRDQRDRRPVRGQDRGAPRERVRDGDPGAGRGPRSEPTMSLDPRALREAFGGDTPPRRQAADDPQRRPVRPSQAAPARDRAPQPRRRPEPYFDDELEDDFIEPSPQPRPQRQPAPDPRNVAPQRRPAPPAAQPRRDVADDRPRRPAPQQPPQGDPRLRRPAPRPRTNQPPDDEDGDY